MPRNLSVTPGVETPRKIPDDSFTSTVAAGVHAVCQAAWRGSKIYSEDSRPICAKGALKGERVAP